MEDPERNGKIAVMMVVKRGDGSMRLAE